MQGMEIVINVKQFEGHKAIPSYIFLSPKRMQFGKPFSQEKKRGRSFLDKIAFWNPRKEASVLNHTSKNPMLL